MTTDERQIIYLVGLWLNECLPGGDIDRLVEHLQGKYDERADELCLALGAEVGD